MSMYEMYEILKEPKPYRLCESGKLLIPEVTFVGRYGEVIHIDQDDGCYVLVVMQEDGYGEWRTHWFPAAISILKSLPTPRRGGV